MKNVVSGTVIYPSCPDIKIFWKTPAMMNYYIYSNNHNATTISRRAQEKRFFGFDCRYSCYYLPEQVLSAQLKCLEMLTILMINPLKRFMHMKIDKNLILAAVLIPIIMAAGSNQIFLKTSAVVLQQQQPSITNNTTATAPTNIRPNIQTDFNPNVTSPKISKAAYVDPFAVIIGDCEIGKLNLVAPFAVCRGDEGTPIHIADYSNVQEGVFLHALETTDHGKNIDDRRYSAQGALLKANDTAFKNGFAIYILAIKSV
jgi:hypothetical protein